MPYVPLSTIKIFVAKFEELLSGYNVKKFAHGELINVYLINDSLVILLEAVEPNAPREYNTDYILRIEELTHNDIGFKYNHAKFVRMLEK